MRSITKMAAFAIAVASTGGLLESAALAGQTEDDKLAAYIGNWKGDSALVGGSSAQPFSCRLAVKKGNPGKINYAGRCSVSAQNLSVTGTIAYDDSARRYAATMISNVGFKGQAFGRNEGNAIRFDLKETDTDSGGNDIRIGALLWLLPDDTIRVDFEVEFNNSGQVATARVPFSR